MELYDIIKTDEFLISLYVGLIILISFLLFKIRNQAKKIKIKKFDISKAEEGNNYTNNEKTETQIEMDNESSVKKVTLKIKNEHHKEKFIVINKVSEPQYSIYSNFQQSPLFSELYEKTESKRMFRLKPDFSR
jgi:hypothetical protein